MRSYERSRRTTSRRRSVRTRHVRASAQRENAQTRRDTTLTLSASRTLTSLAVVTQPRSPRARRKSAQLSPAAAYPIGTPTNGVLSNTGPLATAAWLVERGLISSEARWYAEILLSTSSLPPDEESPTLLRVELFSEEWGFAFRHAGKASWIRVTDVPFVHGRDDHNLLAVTPALRTFGALVRNIEARFDVRFAPDEAVIRSSLFGAEPAIRAWIGDW